MRLAQALERLERVGGGGGFGQRLGRGDHEPERRRVVGVGAEVDLPVATPVALAVRPSGEYLLATDITVADRVFTRTMGQVNLDLIARLGARIGLEAITRMRPADSHIPEKTAATLAAAGAAEATRAE